MGSGRDISGDGVGDLLVRVRSGGGIGVRTGQRRRRFGATLGLVRRRRALDEDLGRPDDGQRCRPTSSVVGALGRSLVVKANNGLRNVESLVTTNLKLPDASMVLNAGDWNRDGKGDIIARDTNKDRLVLYPGRGGRQVRRRRA